MNAATINKDLLPTDTAALHALVRELLRKLKISDLRADRAEYSGSLSRTTEEMDALPPVRRHRVR